jgi:hypothetical protein
MRVRVSAHWAATSLPERTLPVNAGLRFDGLTPDPFATVIAVPLSDRVRAKGWGAPRLGH